MPLIVSERIARAIERLDYQSDVAGGRLVLGAVHLDTEGEDPLTPFSLSVALRDHPVGGTWVGFTVDELREFGIAVLEMTGADVRVLGEGHAAEDLG